MANSMQKSNLLINSSMVNNSMYYAYKDEILISLSYLKTTHSSIVLVSRALAAVEFRYR